MWSWANDFTSPYLSFPLKVRLITPNIIITANTQYESSTVPITVPGLSHLIQLTLIHLTYLLRDGCCGNSLFIVGETESESLSWSEISFLGPYDL